jgi:chromosome segregation ATPase
MSENRHASYVRGVRAGLVSCTVVALAGCANVSTDPRTGGLAGGINGIVTGAYEQRIEDRKTELSDLERAEDRMRGRVAVAKTELAELERRLGQRRTALQKMRGEIAGIGRRISDARADAENKRTALAAQNSANADTQAKADALKAKINELSADLDKLQRLTRELEENNRQEALLYQRLKKPKEGDGGQETIIADIEQRSKTAEQQTADASARLERLKAATAKMSL